MLRLLQDGQPKAGHVQRIQPAGQGAEVPRHGLPLALEPGKGFFPPAILIVACRDSPRVQCLDHQCTTRAEQGVHGGEQRNDVLVQQGEVGADQVVVAADVHLGLHQFFIARHMHLR